MILVRVDSGYKIGIGHVMRCLNLCKFLNKYDNINFICRNHDGNIISKILESFHTIILPLKINTTLDHNTWLGTIWENDCNDIIKLINDNIWNVNLLIIDHYSIDYKWEIKIRPYINKILVIDDISNREHNCDYLLDQNLYFENPYVNLVPKDCKIFLGLQYVILNENFKKIKSINNKLITHTLINDKLINDELKIRINISFWGSDIHNITEKIIDNIIKNKNKIKNFNDIIFDIIVGASNKNYDNIKNKQLINFNIYYSVDNMAELLNKTDLCIGATGSSIYERLYLKIPTIAITVADNQINIAKNLDKIDIIKYIGHYNNINYDSLIYYINNYNEIIVEDQIINLEFDNMINELVKIL